MQLNEASLFDAGSDDEAFVPFTDILFNALLGFTLMLFVAFALVKQEGTGAVDVKAEVLITVTWPDNHPDDIDIYVEDPAGNILYFSVQETGLLHLDRDDRGNYADTIVFNGEELQNPLNQETVTLRGIVPGEFVVNVHRYVANDQEPVPVNVRVDKLNPKTEVVYYGTTMLERCGHEETVIRFTLDEDGNFGNLNTEPKPLVGQMGKSGWDQPF